MNSGIVSSAPAAHRFEYESSNKYNSPISSASPYSSSSSPSPISSLSSSSNNSSASLISKSFALLSDYEDRKHFHRPFEKHALVAADFGRGVEDGLDEENYPNVKRKSDEQIRNGAKASSSPVSFVRSLQYSKRFKFAHSGSKSVDQTSNHNSPEHSRPSSADIDDSQSAQPINYSSETYFKLKAAQPASEEKPAESGAGAGDASGSSLKNKFFRDFFFNLRDSVLKDPDTSLVLENGQSLNAHELMLVNSSTYFRRKLNKLTTSLDDDELKLVDKSNPKNAKLKHCIKLSGVRDYASLKICIDFIYSGGTEISLPSNRIKSIKKTAEILELGDLVKLCANSEKLLESKPASSGPAQPRKEPSPLAFSSHISHTPSNDAPYFERSSNPAMQPSILQQISNCQNIHQMMLQQQQQTALQTNSGLLLDPLLTTTYFLNHLSNAAAAVAAQKQSDQLNSFNSLHSISSASPAKSAMMKKANSIDHSFPSSFAETSSPLKPSAQEKLLSFKSNSFQEPCNDAPKSFGFEKVLTQGHQLINDPIMLDQVREHLRKLTTDPLGSSLPRAALASVLSNLFMIDTISKEFIIKDKYIYPSLLKNQTADKAGNIKAITTQLDEYLSNYSFIDSNFSQDSNSTSQFNRQSLLIFSVSINDSFKFNNFVIKCSLDFTNINSLRDNIKKSLELSLIQTLNSLNISQLSIQNDLTRSTEKQPCVYHSLGVDVSQFFYLKKPSNCKTIRMESIKSSTDCFRAIVEYSRGNLSNELPCVLMTASASVKLTALA